MVLSSRLGDVEQQPLHSPARLRVEGAEGLVHEHQLGLVDEGARDGDALLHAPREVLRVAVGEVGEPHRLRGTSATAARRSARGTPRRLQAVLHVLAHRQPAERGVGLEHHAPVAPDADAPARRSTRTSPLRRRQEPGDGLEERRLAAARGAEEDDDLAARPACRRRRRRRRGRPRCATPSRSTIGHRDVRRRAAWAAARRARRCRSQRALRCRTVTATVPGSPTCGVRREPSRLAVAHVVLCASGRAVRRHGG